MKNIADIEQEIVNNIEEEFNQTIPTDKISFLRVFVRAIASQIALQNISIEQYSKEIYPQTASEFGLNYWSQLVNVRRILNTTARYEVEIVKTKLAITNDENDTEYKFNFSELLHNELSFVLDNSEAEDENIYIYNSSKVGKEGNAPLNTPLLFADNNTNLFYTAKVVKILRSGNDDIESIPKWRERILTKLHTRDLTGTIGWYRNIALSVSEVEECYVYTNTETSGIVDLYVKLKINSGVGAKLKEIEDKFNEPQNDLLYLSSSSVLNKVIVKEVIDHKLSVQIKDLVEPVNVIENRKPLEADIIYSEITEAIKNYLKSRKPYIPSITEEKNSILYKNEVISEIQKVINTINPLLRYKEVFINTTQSRIGWNEIGSQISDIYKLNKGENVSLYKNKIDFSYSAESFGPIREITEGKYSSQDITSVESLISDDIYYIEDRAFSYNDINEITFSKNLIRIGEYAFYHNPLDEITITDFVEIGLGAFKFNLGHRLRVNLPRQLFNSFLARALYDRFDLSASFFDLDGEGLIVYNRPTKINDYEYINRFIEGVLDYAYIPDFITVIGDNAFAGNQDITGANFPSGLTTIGSRAFVNNDFREVELPNSVQILGSSVWSRNSLLTTVRMSQTLFNDLSYEELQNIFPSNPQFYNLETGQVMSKPEQN